MKRNTAHINGLYDQTSNYRRLVSSFLLISIFGTFTVIAGFSFTNKAQAFIIAPVIPAIEAVDKAPLVGSGKLEQLDILTRETLNLSVLGHELTQSATISGMNKALQIINDQLIKDLENKLGIKDFARYQDALVESKYLTDSLRKTYDKADLPAAVANCFPGDVTCEAENFENLPLSLGDPKRAAALGALDAQGITNATSTRARRQNQERRNRQIQNILLGATVLFTSPISCAGINTSAVRNAAYYLAGASAGVLASEIRPERGIDFYSDMARLGSPFATPPFWTLVFQDNAATHEAKARQAAALEVTSPGLKATQNIPSRTNPNNPSSGRTEINRSLNILTASQNRAFGSIFDTTHLGGFSTAPSFGLFMSKYLTLRYLDTLIEILNRRFARLVSFGQTTNASKQIDALITPLVLKNYASAVAKVVVRQFTRLLYQRVAGLLFQGRVIAESAGCRKQSQSASFTSALDPENPDGIPPPTDPVFFDVVPSEITQGEPVYLTWDGSLVDSPEESLTISLSPLPAGCGPILEISGTCQDLPQSSTTYTLTVSGPSANISVARTVTVRPPPAPPDINQVLFSVTPTSGVAPLVVTLDWDVTTIPGVEVRIEPLSEAVLPPQAPPGGVQYTANESVTFTLYLVDADGELVADAQGQVLSKSISVTVSEPVVPPRARNPAAASVDELSVPSFRVRE